MGSMFLIIIDAYSKWIEVFKTTTSTSELTIEKLGRLLHLAERAVRIFQEGIKKMDKSTGSLMTKLQRFLLNYHTTPQTPTGIALAELFINQKLRTKLDFVKPEIHKRVETRQLCMDVMNNSVLFPPK